MVVALENRSEQAHPEEKWREIRLGLVMYGGVSLAIYINGVAQEFFRAVHGRGVYRLIKALTDSDIVVDVISGTSAGGINGIFLSYALCNGKDFSQFANLWREHGDINKLLRAPDGEIPHASSFLDSEGYYQPRLEEAFRNMGDYVPELGEDPSAIDELDLFITGTDVDGTVWTQFDDAGHPIDVKDHRTVFLLKHRRGRKEQLSPKPPEATFEALAKLSRLTSCFPAAFAPVHVARVEPGEDSADAKLQLWGALGKDAYFLDGGVLDNKPFTHTIKAIFSRTANREVERKLFYVEPDPERLQQAQRETGPNFLQAILAALIGIPGYESIAEDLKLLSERNSKLQQYNRLVRQFQPVPVGGEVRDLYRRSRLVYLSERVVQGLFRTGGRSSHIRSEHRKKAARLVRLFDDLPVDPDALFRDFDVPFRMRRVFRMVYLIYDLLYGEEATVSEEQAERYKALWGTFNRQIKLYEVLRSAMEALVDEAPIAWQDVPQEREGEIWEQIETAYARLVDESEAPAGRIREEHLEAFLAGQEEWLSQAQLRAIHADLKDLSARIVEQIATSRLAAPDPRASLLVRLEGYERRLLEHFLPEPEDPVRKAYEDFEALDAHLFPLEMVGNLHEKDIIETIRISPQDANKGFSQNSLAAKVSGDAVYHFGGFFKRSWRSNDILWGRLDGLCQLVETLLDRQRIAKLVATDGWRSRLRARFFERDDTFKAGLDPKDLFPNAGARTQEQCGQWLKDLLSNDPEARQAALDETRFGGTVALLIEAAQLEVIKEDLPSVITDAIMEQAEWNRFQVARRAKERREEVQEAMQRSEVPGALPVADGADGAAAAGLELPPWVFQSPGGRLDPLVATAAAAVRMKDAMDALNVAGRQPARPAETRLGTFFRQSYRVGSEELTRDVPTIVLLEILAKVLLVARTCILGLFQEDAARIRRNPLYRFCIDLPLRAFHGLVGLSRRAPGWGLGVFIGLGALSLVALLFGVSMWGEIIRPQGEFLRMRFALLILAPVLILFFQARFMILASRWFDTGLRLAAFLGLAGLAVAALTLGIFELPEIFYLDRSQEDNLGAFRWTRIHLYDTVKARLELVFLILLPILILGFQLLFLKRGLRPYKWLERKWEERKKKRQERKEARSRQDALNAGSPGR